MKKAIHFITLGFMLLISSCSQHTYLINQPKKYYISPPVIFMTTIVSFRERKGVWPGSMNDLIADSEENRQLVDNFPYEKVRFHIKRKDILEVRFSGYKKDLQFNSSQSGERVDHRMVDGTVRFYKNRGKYAWDVYYKYK